MQCLRSFGTDGEKALIEAFSHEFRYATHLYCHIHVRNNVKLQLSQRKYPESVTRAFLDKILGKKFDSTYQEGLVDALDNDDFFMKLESIKERREKDHVGVVPGFCQWFCDNKVDIMTSGMISSVREDAGLGCPPAHFTTNASESLNAVLKRKVNFKKSELSMFLAHLKDVIDEQTREVQRAVIGRGKYQFRFRMSRNKKRNICKK